jgi:hypothetical protein
MGRNREYASDAERARAWRDRVREELRRARGEAGAKATARKQVSAKLVKVLGQLGSDNENIRDIAARTATRILKEAGFTWYDVLDVEEESK